MRRLLAQAAWWLGPVAMLAVVGWIDYVTGPLLAFSPFYVAVLVVIALRRRWPVAMAHGVLAALIFLAVDLATVPELRWTIYPYWRSLGLLFSFSLVTFTIPRLMEEQRRLAESRAVLVRQRRELNELNTLLVQTLEERTGERERVIEELVGRHAAEVRGLTSVVERLRTKGRL